MIPAYLMLGRTGDLISLLPLLKSEFDRTHEKQQLMVSKDYAAVLTGVSYVEPVIFNGRVDELDRAYDEAKKLGDVKCLQVIGATDSVKRCTYGPAGQLGARTDSFQKEPWFLADRMEVLSAQPPVEFDRRDAERESRLIKQHFPKGKKTILVATGGITNPFPYRELLFELLKLGFKSGYNIVDLSTIKAEYIYDLLGLYERAYCLVVCDSAPLHLARACKSLPVVALVNDRPSLWHGSAYAANHVAHIRYGDFASRGVDVLRAIQGIGGKISYFSARNGEVKLVHAWSCYELSEENLERHQEASSTWNTTGEQGAWIDARCELGASGRDSKLGTALKDDQRFPFLKDVIRVAAQRANDSDIIVLTRCDTGFGSNLTEKLLLNAPCWSHRSIWQPNIADTHAYTFHPIVDLFAFTKAWWKEHQSECPDLILDNGWWWNRVLLALVKKHGGKESLPFSVHRAPGTLKPITGLRPRERHNSELHRKWEEANGPIILYPAVHKQLPTVLVNRHSLHPYAYNASIVEHNGRTLLAYRHHDQQNHSTALAIAGLDDKFNVKWRKDVQLSHRGGSEEDPQLFVTDGKLHLAYVDSTYPILPPKSVMRYGALLEDTVFAMPQFYQPEYGKNDGTAMEKNWRFFEHSNGVTWFIYQSQPEQIIVGFRGEKFFAEYRCASPRWPWGEIKGGTQPLLYDGKLLRFFHSSLDNEAPPFRRRYYVGATLMELTPPYTVLEISKEPILRGSEEDSLSMMERAGCYHHKAKVVFPLGVIKHGDGWLLSCGLNDSSIGLVSVQPKDLKL